ncbi:MAG TPA: nuclear transport factor 2 family protein [Blastocatellia bacterium]
MGNQNAASVIRSFIDKINDHDVHAMTELMDAEHLFVDSLGQSFRGREMLRQGWTVYFTSFPDYRISYDEIFERGDTVAFFGDAKGTYAVDGELLDSNSFRIPAAWKALVKDGLVAEWHVYADNHPVVVIMERNQERNQERNRKS